MTLGDPRVLPAGERIRGRRRADPRDQHGQQVFPPGVDPSRARGVELPSACRFHQAGFEGVRRPAREARGRAAGNVRHRSGRARPGVHRAGLDRGKERRRDSAARFRAKNRGAVPRRLEPRETIFAANPEKRPALVRILFLHRRRIRGPTRFRGRHCSFPRTSFMADARLRIAFPPSPANEDPCMTARVLGWSPASLAIWRSVVGLYEMEFSN